MGVYSSTASSMANNFNQQRYNQDDYVNNIKPERLLARLPKEYAAALMAGMVTNGNGNPPNAQPFRPENFPRIPPKFKRYLENVCLKNIIIR